MYYPIAILAIEDASDRNFMKSLYDEHYPLMYGVARKIIHCTEDIEDIINDAAIILIGKIDLLRTLNCYKLQVYIVNTIRSTSFNYYKRSKRTAGRTENMGEDFDMPDSAEGPEEQFERRINSEEIRAILQHLPEKYYRILELRYFYDYDDQKIGEILEIAPNNVRTYIMRARKKAKAALQNDRM